MLHLVVRTRIRSDLACGSRSSKVRQKQKYHIYFLSQIVAITATIVFTQLKEKMLNGIRNICEKLSIYWHLVRIHHLLVWIRSLRQIGNIKEFTSLFRRTKFKPFLKKSKGKERNISYVNICSQSFLHTSFLFIWILIRPF